MEASSPLELSKSPVGPLTEATRCARASVGRCAHVCVGVCARARAHASTHFPLYPSPCNSRRTLVYLILILNHIYPGYDFSPLQCISPLSPHPTHSCSRKTLVYLILTLNHIYPDYDFSLLRAHHFKKEDGLAAIEETIDAHLLEVSKVRAGGALFIWSG